MDDTIEWGAVIMSFIMFAVFVLVAALGSGCFMNKDCKDSGGQVKSSPQDKPTQNENWQNEAVARGYAEYVIVDGKTKWQWKEVKR